MSDAPGAGWFPDPTDPSLLRWWDGRQWTEHVQAGVAAAAVPAEPADAEPAKKRRTGWIVGGVAVGAVALLVGVTALAWGPVSSLLFPKYTLAEAGFYESSVDILEKSFDGAATDPLGFRGASEAARQAPGYVAAANEYIAQWIADYGADEREFDSLNDAEEYAYTETNLEFREMSAILQAGGKGTPLEELSFPQDPSIVAIEQQIAAMPGYPDATGSYWASGQEMATLLNVELTDDTSLNDCLGFSVTLFAGAYCPSEANWDRVFIYPPGMTIIDSPRFIGTVKHELAHKLIFLQCNGAYGSANWENVEWSRQYGEGVTNSYAKIFLGADPSQLGVEDDYAMNETTDAKARAIHDSDLACFDDEQLPPPLFDWSEYEVTR